MKAVQIIIAAFFLTACFSAANAQLCGQWHITVAVVDGEDKPVNNAQVKFKDVPEGDDARGKKFVPTDGEEHTFKATFSEGSKVSKKYTIEVSADGYAEKTVEIENTYCQSTSNQIALTANGKPRSAIKLATLSGRATDNKGGIIYSFTVADENGIYYRPKTDAQGFYSIKLKPGVYQIQLKSANCDYYSSEPFKIGAGNVKQDIIINCQR